MEAAAFKDFYPVLDAGAVDLCVVSWHGRDARARELGHPPAPPHLTASRIPRPPSPPRSIFVGHVHYYNRDLPYDAVTGNIDYASSNADNSTYTNPRHIVTIVTGASGDKEGETPCVENILPPSVHCDPDYGFGYFQALNATHATWLFRSVKPDWFGPANFTDSLLVIQDGHAAGNAGARARA